MTDILSDQQAWGHYRPKGKNRVVTWIVKLGFGHGRLKKWLRKLWLAKNDRMPADIIFAGVKFRLHPWDSSIEGKMLFGSAALRDPTEMRILKDHLRNGGVFLDIGANVGYYSLIAASAGASQVLAVEPNPIAFRRLVFNINANQLNEKITPVQYALGAKTGTATLSISSTDIGGSRVGDSNHGEKVTVPMMSLQELLAARGITRIDALKIDVEGMEDVILIPFFKTNDRSLWPRLLIMEHTSGADWKSDLLSTMLESGYVVVGESRSNIILRFP